MLDDDDVDDVDDDAGHVTNSDVVHESPTRLMKISPSAGITYRLRRRPFCFFGAVLHRRGFVSFVFFCGCAFVGDLQGALLRLAAIFICSFLLVVVVVVSSFILGESGVFPLFFYSTIS